jgi:hypothetical protein
MAFDALEMERGSMITGTSTEKTDTPYLNIGGHLRKPTEDSLNKAFTLLMDTPVTIFYVSGNFADPGGGYLALGLAPRILTFSRRMRNQLTYHEMQTLLAMWIDQLDIKTTFVHSWYHKESLLWLFDSGTYHTSMWEAEMEALTRPRSLVYDYANDRYFMPRQEIS